MKKFKKLLATIIVGTIVVAGIIQTTTLNASAYTIIDIGDYPGTVFDLSWSNTYSPYVQKIQSALISLGYSCGAYGADGYYGNSTYSAVVSFQVKHYLDTDGRVGRYTWNALRNAAY